MTLSLRFIPTDRTDGITRSPRGRSALTYIDRWKRVRCLRRRRSPSSPPHPESSGKQLLPRTDARHGGYSTTNLFTMLFEVVTRDHMASRHRTARRADPRWVMIWPPIAGDNASWPPKRLTSVVEIIKFQEVVSRTAHFM